MITQIIGRLVEKTPTQVVIDCNGVGYAVHISLHTFSQISNEESIKLFTHLQVREDAHTLFGFHTPIERSIFLLLISVSGIGASTARTMLSSLEPQQIQRAILSEDLNTIKSVKGIGLKTAQRVLIELKDKMINLHDGEEIQVLGNNTIKDEALSALEVLGYSRKQSERIVDRIIQTTPDCSVEGLIKEALNKL
ncbi:Holliday junction branch migration protein RuvA [Flavobacteriaceae bacterium]|jgi:Holliday junction DNA helicase RuvA|nr:Holliday junction branch migration protein RuvA [Flavobacteriaceae bacterium]MDA7808322.1 Holliday junction branch migration protein RuvA [Flavobacteriaceae bacterium]MDA8877769.1 Holliday junction branch migration protein RuvA [Flavobacteriaceae bacterium]MDA9037865.1 Holliday junction branch migration protein RuvA [Flavobacteriaceae bacterium]MDA9851855.1 Holliday junction branch migration protein RuvA [Flavobacteriaceae bacterium]